MLTLFPAPAGPDYTYRATCTRVIDGDTFVADVDLGYEASIQITVRLFGVNAPELHSDGGRPAASWLQAQIINRPLLLQSHKDARSFTRWVCDVWIVGQAEHLGQLLIEAGHAVAFDPRVDHWTP